MIEVRDLHKAYDGPAGRGEARRSHALRGVSLTVPPGKLVSLLGPSGCGKTSTLRAIAGLIRPDAGDIDIDGETVFSVSKRIFAPPERRGIGMVFQSYAIWPHMTVFENVAYALEARKAPRKNRREQVMVCLAMVGLEDLAERAAPALSGGQQQRVALARALVAEPRVLLLDEPLSNLDAKLRDQMRFELRRLQRELGITALYVTHDQQEALSVSDQIVVMKNGKVLDVGAPGDLYVAPRYRFTADFLGQANFISGVVRDRSGAGVRVETGAGDVVIQGEGAKAGAKVTLFFRPEDARLVDPGATSAGNRIVATVVDVAYLGGFADCRLVVESADLTLRARTHPKEAPDVGSVIAVELREGACRLVADDEAGADPYSDGSLASAQHVASAGLESAAFPV